MNDMDLIRALRRIVVETGALVCQGCCHEHNCSTHGCAVINEAVERLEMNQRTTLVGTYVSGEWFNSVEADLKKYKATRLDPEEITTEPYGCVFYCNRKCNLDGDFCAEGPGCPYEIGAETAKHILELAQAEKDGRLVVMPVKEGTKIYRLGYRLGGKYSIDERYFSLTYFRNEILGETIFLTREEAEAALKKREADDEAD